MQPKTILIIAVVISFMMGCQVQMPAKRAPHPSTYETIQGVQTINGYPVERTGWFVYSAQADNKAYRKKTNKFPQPIEFMEPLIVLKNNKAKDMIKVAKYSPNAVLSLSSKSDIQTYGWIPKKYLLEWDNAIRDKNSGFALKATVLPVGTEIMSKPEFYMEKDSAYVFNSPNMSQKPVSKIPLGKLIYIYKKSHDGRSYLVGKESHFDLENSKESIIGWVSADIVSVWGSRAAFEYKPKASATEEELAEEVGGIYDTSSFIREPIISPMQMKERVGFQNIYPISYNAHVNTNRTQYFAKSLNYDESYIYNVLGEKLFYKRFKEITQRAGKLNVAFVIDVSEENASYAAGKKNMIQRVQDLIDKDLNYHTKRQALILYGNNSCGAPVLIKEFIDNPQDLIGFLESELANVACKSAKGGQPINLALREAGDFLKNYQDETNLIVLVGSTSKEGLSKPETVRSLTAAKARIIAYQTHVTSADNYSRNFPQLLVDLIRITADNISTLNKENIADVHLLTKENSFEESRLKQGVSVLDYPKNSMTQGAILYPAEGDNNPVVLINEFKTLLSQVTHQNQRTHTSLLNQFADAASIHSYVEREYQDLYPGAENPLDVDFAKGMIGLDYHSLVRGYVPVNKWKKSSYMDGGILISEFDYDNLRTLYQKIYDQAAPEALKFNPKKAVRKYVKLMQKEGRKVPRKNKPRRYAALTNQEMFQRVVGYGNFMDARLTAMPVKSWGKDDKVSNQMIREYFDSFNDLIKKMTENKYNPKYRLEQHGTVYYWLNKEYMPKFKDEISLEEPAETTVADTETEDLKENAAIKKEEEATQGK